MRYLIGAPRSPPQDTRCARQAAHNLCSPCILPPSHHERHHARQRHSNCRQPKGLACGRKGAAQQHEAGVPPRCAMKRLGHVTGADARTL